MYASGDTGSDADSSCGDVPPLPPPAAIRTGALLVERERRWSMILTPAREGKAGLGAPDDRGDDHSRSTLSKP